MAVEGIERVPDAVPPGTALVEPACQHFLRAALAVVSVSIVIRRFIPWSLIRTFAVVAPMSAASAKIAFAIRTAGSGDAP